MAFPCSDEEFWEESERWESPAHEEPLLPRNLTLRPASQPRLPRSSHRRHDRSARARATVWLPRLACLEGAIRGGGPTWSLVRAIRRMEKWNG